MTRNIRTRACLGLIPLLCWGTVSQAHDYKAGSLIIEHPWVQVVPGLPGGAGYLAVTNTGKEPDRLTGATVGGSAGAELHVMSGDGRMEPVAGGLEIEPGKTVKLSTGSYHFMFPDLKGPFKVGVKLTGTLRFHKAGTVAVEFEVQSAAAHPSHQH